MLVLGFGAGMPFILIYGTLPFRLREAGVGLATIGFASWVVLFYPFKWVWAPLVDRLALPWLTRRFGRRLAWLLLAQCAIVAGLLLMALVDPREHLPLMIACALLSAFAGATQDVALDAYRIEVAQVERQAALAAMYHSGYRLGMIWGGAGALWLAARAAQGALEYRPQAWTAAYAVMAASMIVSVLVAAFAPEGRAEAARAAPDPSLPPEPAALADRVTPPQQDMPPEATQRVAMLLAPFKDLARRWGWYALLVFGLISSYRLANLLMGVMANPFYHDIGFTKDQVAAVSKIYGVALSLVGGFVGGVLTLRIGIRRVMWGAALVSSASILLYALLATRGPDITLLIVAVSTDNFAEGIAGTVFIAYLSGLTNRNYSATQYAFLSSSALLLPKIAAGFSGVAVETFGYPAFFCGCALTGIIPLVLMWAVRRYVPDQRFSKR